MNPLIQLKQTTPVFLVGLMLACFAISPMAQAVVPAPDGGYPGGNTAEGQGALLGLTTGRYNTAVGWLALRSNTEGPFNTAVGAGALFANMSTANTATGAGALLSTTGGGNNTANGAVALFSNTIGQSNTATGAGALFTNTASDNTADGFQALFNNTTGSLNTANGSGALPNNDTGVANTATGAHALQNNTSGSGNTATGQGALFNSTGNGNTVLGSNAGNNVTTANNVIAIGHIGANVDNSCFIGHIRGVTTQNADAIPVLIDSFGQLGTASSSRRFKKEIKPMDKASEAILGLKPVTFQYKSDKRDTPQFGLIAEEVAKVNPNLVVRDETGEIYTVRYDAVNAMLLNEFLKAHSKVEKQEATITRLTNDFQTVSTQQRNEIQLLSAQLKGQAAQIQKVSAQLEASKPAPQVVNNP